MSKLFTVILATMLLATLPAMAATEMNGKDDKTAGITTPRADKAAPAADKKSATEASAIVSAFYEKLQAVMEQGDKLGFEGRYEQLKPVVEKAFDLQQMTRFAVGPSWNKVTAEEQGKLVDAFSAFSVANYATRFKAYHGEQFLVGGEHEAHGGGLIVQTTLLPKNDGPVMLNYLMRKDEKGKWRITDVYLDATISELATRRAEFSSIVSREGVDTLISTLGKKTQAMRES
ncbi:MAG: organic solvent ABC transporter [Alphaproteobacteria bacterium]|nr:organic solvent ABC transporter [Alphaproteobacteria bacterium]